MQYELCRHIKTNGIQCKAPSLTGEDWCYFHNRLHQRHSSYRHTAATRGYLLPGQHIQLTALEDRESVQVALSVVINALATGHLDTKRATALLYGLQLAATNSSRIQAEPFAPSVVRALHSTPDGLDLAEPGAIYEISEYEEHEEDEDDEDDEY
jgi:hypothetical protein